MLTINLLEYIQLSIERMIVLLQYEIFLYFPLLSYEGYYSLTNSLNIGIIILRLYSRCILRYVYLSLKCYFIVSILIV